MITKYEQENFSLAFLGTELCFVPPLSSIKKRGGAIEGGEEAVLSSELLGFHLCDDLHPSK